MRCFPPCRCRRAYRSPASRSTAQRARRCWPPGSSDVEDCRNIEAASPPPEVTCFAPTALAVISRYTRPELALVWSEERKLESWLQVEVAVCEALAEAGVVPGADLEQIKRAAPPDREAVRERERVTDHDVAAFVDVVSADVGEAGRWIHFGLTSSDVLDTALALQLREAGREVAAGADALTAALV